LHTNDFGGTSAATPLVAGIAALILAVRPNLTRQEVKEILAQTAVKIGRGCKKTIGHSPRFGFGRVDAAAAVAYALSLP
jgi:subtilisin family serine protease